MKTKLDIVHEVFGTKVNPENNINKKKMLGISFAIVSFLQNTALKSYLQNEDSIKAYSKMKILLNQKFKELKNEDSKSLEEFKDTIEDDENFKY